MSAHPNSRLRPSHKLRSWVLLGLVATLPAKAQGLIELYEAARGHDATYLAARAQLEATLAKAEQSHNLPTLDLSASSTRYDYQPRSGTDQVYGTHAATLTARQNLYKPANSATVEQARLSAQQARASFELAEQDLMVRISQAYFDVLTAQESLSLVRAQKIANAEQLASAKRNFEVGTATITDTHEAQARFDLAQAQEIATDNELAIKKLSLLTIVGRQTAQPKPLTQAAPLPALAATELEGWVEKAQTSHPGIESARLALSSAQLEVAKSEAGHKPTLEGVLTYGTTYSAGSSSATTRSRSDTASAGLVFTLPLFSGFATVNKVRESLALEDKARTDLEASRRSVTQNTRSNFLSYQAGLAQVKALEAAQVSSKSALEANQLGYQVGVRINIDVLNAQSQLYQTRRDLAKARHDALLAYLKLRQAAGVLQAHDLQPIDRLIDRK